MEPIEEQAAEPAPSNRKRKWVATAAVATGLAVGAAGLAGAATGGGSESSTATSSDATASDATSSDDATSQPPTGQPPTGQPPSGQDPSAMTNGPGEEVLTGETATKVTEAALAKYPGATVIRVETDAGDAEYEAHLKLEDGSMVTVLFDAEFAITDTQEGFGPGPNGGTRPEGPPPSDQAPSDASSTSDSSTT